MRLNMSGQTILMKLPAKLLFITFAQTDRNLSYIRMSESLILIHCPRLMLLHLVFHVMITVSSAKRRVWTENMERFIRMA